MTRFNKQGSPYQMKNTIKEKTMIRYEKEGKKRIGKERKGMKSKWNGKRKRKREKKEKGRKGIGKERNAWNEKIKATIYFITSFS